MKSMMFMIFATMFGSIGSVLLDPFYGVSVYYLFATLRPKYLWKYTVPDWNWSFWVAMATLFTACAMPFGFYGGLQQVRWLTAGHRWMIAFAIWIGVTSTLAFDPNVSWDWFVEYLKIFVMFFASSFIVDRVKQLWVLLLIATFGIGYIALDVNILYFQYGYLGIHMNGYGGLDNNGAGLMLAMGVPLVYFCFEGFRGRWRWAVLAFIPIIMHAVMLTYSRGAMLSVIVGVPAMLVCARQRRLLGAFVLVSATIAIPMMAGKEVRERFFTVSKYNVDESVGVRFASWRAAYNMAWDYPVFGVGVRNSNLFSFRYGADMEGRTIHSQYLQIAADSGWIGLTFYLLTAMMSLWGAYRVKSLLGRHADGEGRIANAIAGGSICSLILFFFGAAFLSVEVFELPYLLIFLAAQLRLLVNPAEQISEWLPQSDAPSSALPVAV